MFLNCGLCKRPHPLASSPDMRGETFVNYVPENILPISPIYTTIREENIGGGLEIKKGSRREFEPFSASPLCNHHLVYQLGVGSHVFYDTFFHLQSSILGHHQQDRIHLYYY